MRSKEAREQQKEDEKKLILNLQVKLRQALAKNNQDEAREITNRIKSLRGI